MNVEQRIAALEALLEKVQKNAALPRPERAGIGSLAVKPGDDVVGAPIPTLAEAATPIVTKKPDIGDDLWDEAPAKDASPAKGVAIATPLGTPKTPPAKPAPVTTAAKPAAVPGPKPIAPVTTAAKPAAVTPAAAKPAAIPGPKPITPVATGAKPAATTPAPTKPAALPKLTTPTATPIATKPAVPVDELKRTLPGVGEGEEAGDSRPPPLQDSDAITAPLALAPEQIEALIGTGPAAAKKPETSTGLPSAIEEDGDGEDAEPTKLFEPASTSKPSAALVAALAKSAEPEKKPEPEQAQEPVLEAKPEPEAVVEIEAAAPEKKPESERKPAPEKKPEPEAVVEIEAAAPEKKPESEKKPAPAKKPEVETEEASIELGAAELEPKPEPEKKPVAKPPLPTKKPEVEKKPVAETKPPVEKKPVVVAKEPVETKPEPEPKKGLPGWLLVAAALLLIGAGAFVAMQKGWIGGLPGGTQPGNTGGSVTPTPTPTPTETVKAAPTPATAETAPAPSDSAVAAPPGSASAAPAGSASAAPATSASAAPTTEAPPAKDPATLPATRGILTVSSNKQALVFLTGKLVGNTGEALEVDCGPKFIRLADMGETNPTKAKWLTPGQSAVINCQKANTVTINVP
ncbi:hypothetical protein [Polyangium jinanense]|uniref:Uncharacterized protein n=1 Tax=Polyangium jinanense TaxID=2829994 RepID=A0A9X3X9Y9_9BACT|nr:hypothetical protein [Polyangium jinanense]MDC3961322.1 hypothetical protein [Polyangium jinanense]MDC3984046.1 hypothetical protein [Polyangium jinanense]